MSDAANGVAPAWALAQLKKAEEDHPGRHEGEVGISTLTWDPSLTNRALNGEEVPQAKGSRLAKGTFLHWILYGQAPFRETPVRVRVEGLDLFLAGHIDAADPELLAIRDLKTTDRFDMSKERLEEVRRQLGLYAYCCLHGEANAGTHEEPEWIPAAEFFGFAPERVLMDLWPAGDIAWGRLDIQGDEFLELAESSYAWACEQIREMVAGTWTPPKEVVELEETALAPEEVLAKLTEAGRLAELLKEAKPRYKQLRAEIYAAVDDTVRAGPYQAVYTSPSTKEVLNLERVTAELEEAGEDLAEYQFDDVQVKVEDPAALAHLVEELVEAGIVQDEAGAGISVKEVPTLEEQRLRAQLKELEVLEACTSEKTTRKGYVSIRKLGGGSE